MAQREFYFANGFSWGASILSCYRNFMILLQFCYAAGNTIFVKSLFLAKFTAWKSKLGLQFMQRRHAKRQFSPPLLIRLATLFLKGRLSPAFFKYLARFITVQWRGSENKQDIRPTWVDRDGIGLNLIAKPFIFRYTRFFAVIYFPLIILHVFRHEKLPKLLFRSNFG